MFTMCVSYYSCHGNILIFSHLYENKEEMLSAAMAMAALIASKSPVAMTSTKHNLIYSRDHPVDDGLNYMVSSS